MFVKNEDLVAPVLVSASARLFSVAARQIRLRLCDFGLAVGLDY